MEHESTVGEKRTERRIDCGRGGRGLRICGDERVERGGAGGGGTAEDLLLAGGGDPDLEQNPVWRISREAWLRRTLEKPDERPLATDDSRRTRAIPPGYVQPLRPLRCGGSGGIA